MTQTQFDGADDIVLPFAVEALDVRGRVVRLGDAVDTLVNRHGYPDAVARVVGEAAALTALLGSALKFDGRFQLQTKTDGAVEMIVVDYDAPDRLRAFARFDADKVAATGADSGALLGQGHLAMTIDQGPSTSRYQGIVPLEGQGLEEAAHQYFRQSEQIPTRVRLAVAEELTGGETRAYRAGGLMVQFLPTSPERQRQAELPPGDIPDGHPAHAAGAASEDDAWVEARSLVDTVEDHELIDPALSSERLLFRLFHERGVRVFEGQGIREACRCSRERVMDVLTRFDADERREMVADDGRVQVTCEFCSRKYAFDPSEIEAKVEG
ncbi:Hsp33 family molecular chaperone [Salinarimonas ramus]|uniref:33 kDa chaperonin n=1 Tax=Salinarimonas ramus TaxID=690164 RepID=A0A917Q8H6_9HYPH|nr:Hsp33 family molecular chaperone [Salinarimonas ramus]GGK35900.1 33 kDa chaperonin [Salinarimonas ramus]